MVEPRLERAAEVVERRLEQAAEESSGFNNPFPHSGNDKTQARMTNECAIRQNLLSLHSPASLPRWPVPDLPAGRNGANNISLDALQKALDCILDLS